MMSTNLPKPLRLSPTTSLSINCQNAQWGRRKNGWVAGPPVVLSPVAPAAQLKASHWCSDPWELILGQILFNVFINGWGDGTVYPRQVCRQNKTGRSSWYTKWLCHSKEQIKEFTWGESDEVQQSKKSCTWGGVTPCINICWRLTDWEAALEERTWSSWRTSSWTWEMHLYSKERYQPPGFH